MFPSFDLPVRSDLDRRVNRQKYEVQGDQGARTISPFLKPRKCMVSGMITIISAEAANSEHGDLFIALGFYHPSMEKAARDRRLSRHGSGHYPVLATQLFTLSMNHPDLRFRTPLTRVLKPVPRVVGKENTLVALERAPSRHSRWTQVRVAAATPFLGCVDAGRRSARTPGPW